jgi:hypothetical protein
MKGPISFGVGVVRRMYITFSQNIYILGYCSGSLYKRAETNSCIYFMGFLTEDKTWYSVFLLLEYQAYDVWIPLFSIRFKPGFYLSANIL